MVRKSVRPFSVVLKEFEELDVKDARLRAYYEPMSKEEVAALKLGRGSSLIRSKHRHADILHWEDDISTIATVDAPAGERALLATSMRTRSARSRSSTGVGHNTAATGSGRRAWSAHVSRRVSHDTPLGNGKTMAPSNAGATDANGPSCGAPDVPLTSCGEGSTSASAAHANDTTTSAAAAAAAGAAAIPGSVEGNAKVAPSVAVEGRPGGEPAAAPPAPTAVGEGGNKKQGRPTSARPPSGRARNAAQESTAGFLGTRGVGSHDDPVQGPPLSHALRAALQGAARSMTRPMSAQPPTSQPRSKLIEQYIEAQRIRPQTATPLGNSPEKCFPGPEGTQNSSPADQAREQSSPEGGQQGQETPTSPQRRLIRFMSEVADRGTGQDSPQQRQQGGDQRPSHAEGTEGAAAEGKGAQAVAGDANKARAPHEPGAGLAGVRIHSAPPARPAAFGRSTIMGARGQARGAEPDGGGMSGSGAGGSRGGSAEGGTEGHNSLLALLGGTGGVGNVPQSLLQIAAEAEAEGVEDVDDAAGMDGEDAIMMQGHHRQSSTTSRQPTLPAGAASRMQLSAQAQLQYFGHCGLATSRKSSARKDRPGQHTHHDRRVRSALATLTTTGAARAAPTAVAGPAHQHPRPISAKMSGPIPAVSFRRAVSAPRTLRHPCGASSDLNGTDSGGAAGGHGSHLSAYPSAFRRVRASSAPRAQRPLSAQQQELLQQHKEGFLQQQQQQRRRPQSAGPMVESPSPSLSQRHLHRASTSASKVSNSSHLGSSRRTGGLSTSPSQGRSHISTAGFPAQVHRGVGEGHDPHRIRMSTLDRPSSACTTYNPEKAAAVYGVRSAARRELIHGMAAAVMAGRRTAAGANLNAALSSGGAPHSEHGGQRPSSPCDAGARGVGAGSGIAAASNGVLARSPSGVPVATHKGVRQQQWLQQRMLRSSALHQQYQERQQQQQGRADYLRCRSGALSNGMEESMGNLRGSMKQPGSAHGYGDCRLGMGLRKVLAHGSSAGPSHSTLGANNHLGSNTEGIRGSLAGRPASAPLQSCDYGKAATAAFPPPLPPPAPCAGSTAPPTTAAAAATAAGSQEQQGRGSRPSSARPMSGNSRPQSGLPSSARDSCVLGSAVVGDGGGTYGGGSSVADIDGHGYNWSGYGYPAASMAGAHGINDGKMKQADWELACERQELGIVDEDSEEGSDSDGL